MRFFVATLLATASIFAPVVGFAESADVEATIKKVDTKNLSITLDDGKIYQTPDDFDFNGLEAGVKVIVFYTEVDGKRVINDLDIVQ
jgi:Cu/Ag efflux protein CusF